MNGQTISEKELRELVEFDSPNCVSVCIPTDPTSPDPRTNATAFKNQINKATSLLKTLDLQESIQHLNQASSHLLNDELFWKEQSGSFLLLVSDNDVRTFTLKDRFEELSMVSDHYYVVPLISQVAQQSSYYILELDKEHTQMWHGIENSLKKVDVPDLPKSVAEVTGTEQSERNLQFHTGTDSPGGGTRPAMFHGSSTWKDDHDRYLLQFLHAVDRALVEFFKHKTEPLILNGTEEPNVMFQKIAHCKNIVDQTIPRVSDPTHKLDRLQEQSVHIVSELYKKRQQSVVSVFEETVPAKRVTVLQDVLRQAALGKIDTLLVGENSRAWGVFSAETQSTIVEDEQKPGSAELVNLAARITLQNSGRVVVLPDDQMPGSALAAATLRY